MVKRSILLLGILFMVFASAYAEEKYTISGEVTFQYDADIYICLLTMEEFQYFNSRGHKLPDSPCKIIQMSTDLKKAGKVSFTFDNVAKGAYCVFTYQDVNMNGKVDFYTFRISEPWGSYKQMDTIFSTSISWEKINFDLESDITGITIAM